MLAAAASELLLLLCNRPLWTDDNDWSNIGLVLLLLSCRDVVLMIKERLRLDGNEHHLGAWDPTNEQLQCNST